MVLVGWLQIGNTDNIANLIQSDKLDHIESHNTSNKFIQVG